jgi:hypothetical protein
MASLIAFDLLRFRAGGRAPTTRSIFSDASSVDYDDAVHALYTHANQGMIKSTAKPYISLGRACAPRRLVDPVRRARADACDRLQTVRPTRAFDPQAYCPPRLAPLAPPPQSVALCAT